MHKLGYAVTLFFFFFINLCDSNNDYAHIFTDDHATQTIKVSCVIYTTINGNYWFILDGFWFVWLQKCKKKKTKIETNKVLWKQTETVNNSWENLKMKKNNNNNTNLGRYEWLSRVELRKRNKNNDNNNNRLEKWFGKIKTQKFQFIFGLNTILCVCYKKIRKQKIYNYDVWIWFEYAWNDLKFMEFLQGFLNIQFDTGKDDTNILAQTTQTFFQWLKFHFKRFIEF